MDGREHGSGMDRRRFFGATMVGAAALLARPGSLWGAPSAPGEPGTAGRGELPARPVRVRGAVRVAGGRGLRGVAVSDGFDVVVTDDDGLFELVTTERAAHVYVSLPAGYRIPLNAEGTARCYQPIRADARSEMSVLFELEPDPRGDREHAFLLLADPQTQNARDMALFHEETVPDARATVAGLGDIPVFGIGCGDLMWDDLSMFPDYERAVRAIGVPFFQVLGNHDLDLSAKTTETASIAFRDRFGPLHYSFDRGDVHYCVLNNVFWYGGGYVGYVTDQQLEWLRRDLARVEPGRTVIVVAHIPVGSTMDRRLGGRVPVGFTTQNRDALYRILEPYRAYILTGHMHEREHIISGTIHEQVNGAVCGAWWTGPICWDGTPNGYTIFRVRGEEISWRYKSVGHAPEHQMRVYPRGANPERPDEIVANIWDWDPSWTVVWYEDGEPKGEMRQEMGMDPLAVHLQLGPDRPSHRSWVDPRNTDHLFYARVSPDAREVVVEARDRFGRVYRASPRSLTEHVSAMDAAHPISSRSA